MATILFVIEVDRTIQYFNAYPPESRRKMQEDFNAAQRAELDELNARLSAGWTIVHSSPYSTGPRFYIAFILHKDEAEGA